MLRKTMTVLCAVASIAILTPDLALARGGGGGGGHGGGGGGHAGGFGGGGFGGRGFGGGSFATGGGSFGNSFARAAPASGIVTAPGSRFVGAQVNHGGFGHGFHGRRFFAGGGFGYYDGYWGYPDYAYDDSYYDDSYSDNGSCYVVQRRVHTPYGWRVRPVQVCG